MVLKNMPLLLFLVAKLPSPHHLSDYIRVYTFFQIVLDGIKEIL